MTLRMLEISFSDCPVIDEDSMIIPRNTDNVRESKEWVITGFSDEIKNTIDTKLMEDDKSFWFRYRSIPWFRRRRIKGTTPIKTIEKALNELHIEAKIWRKVLSKQSSSYWVIEPKEHENNR
ncbi:MAG: hypothetical protein JSV04_12215 [Candidatus Heimdallarchaeota archaeon]|nr:MAG: hypothetical protein JSV04_12215 [Candidatus Heimdallarchaeota archaeon]